MIVLGIILLLIGLAIAAFVLLSGLPPTSPNEVSLELLGVRVDTSAVLVFALGALTLLLLELGLVALRAGARKAARRRSEMQRLRRVESEVQTRQSASAQRNAEALAPAPAAPAPFARRHESTPVSDDTRADTTTPAVDDTAADTDGATAADRTSRDRDGL